MLEEIRERRPSLAASLADAVPTAPGDGSLGLTVPNGTHFHRDQLMDRANMSIMETAASAVFGDGVRVCLEFSVSEKEGRAEAGERDAERRSAAAGTPERGRAGDKTDRGDPMVRRVVEMFDGRITNRSSED
ncbi:MAG: hypothetical protein GF400_08570 [Candidatus Eisenbacteria bacterium]|nr:hypothetical protein [Candidatus Eisenbacteria bacterium]